MLAELVVPPEVVDVLVGGQSWNPSVSPHSIMADTEFDNPLPWITVDQLHVVFSTDVEVVADSLTLVGVNVPRYAPSGFGYDSGSFTATWTFAAPFSADKLLLNLAGEPFDFNPIDDLAGPGGQLLNGGSDFEVRFDILPGDSTRDRATTVTDLANVGLRVGSVLGPPKSTFYQREFDVNADGSITVTDLANVGLRVGSTLPDAEPPQRPVIRA